MRHDSHQTTVWKTGKTLKLCKANSYDDENKGPKGDSQKPTETLFRINLKSITFMELRAHESLGFSDKLDPTKTLMSS